MPPRCFYVFLVAVNLLFAVLPLGVPNAYAADPPDLSIQLALNGAFYVDSPMARLTLTVRNASGAGPTTGPITVTDPLPTGMTYHSIVSQTGGWTCSGTSTVTCTNPGPLNANGTSVLLLRVNVAQAAVGSRTNTATVSTPDEANTSNNTSDALTITVTQTAPPPDLGINLSDRGKFFVGSSMASFRYVISSSVFGGPTTGTTTLTHPLPTGITYHSTADAYDFTCTGTTTVTCTRSTSIAPTELILLTVRVIVDAAAVGTPEHTATVSTPGETITGNNAFTDQMTVAATGTYELSYLRSGTGSGTMTFNPPNESCSSNCDKDYPPGTVVTLTANPAAGSYLSLWSGDCSDSSPTCQITMDEDKTIIASFRIAPTSHPLSVTTEGTGTGSVSSSPAGIDCGFDCVEQYAVGSSVTLTATASPGSTFAGWTGDCSGTGACQVTMSASKSVTATFNASAPPSRLLAVVMAGTGAGTVSSSPAGIECGSDCQEGYTAGTTVTLTATPAPGSVFAGWSGGECSGTGTCQVTLSASKSVTATFNPAPVASHALTVMKAGAGSGTVTSSPAGIACGADCTESYTAGTTVTLTATASPGSTFAGWSGDCTGTGACQVTTSAAKSVTATFTTATVGVVVGPAVGTVAGGDKMLAATLTARAGCGSIASIDFGSAGRPFANAIVSVTSPSGGPTDRTSGFTLTPPSGTTSVAITVRRVAQSGGATVSPIVLRDGCGAWNTFVGGGPDAFR